MPNFLYKPRSNAPEDFSGSIEFSDIDLADIVDPPNDEFRVFMEVQISLVISIPAIAPTLTGSVPNVSWVVGSPVTPIDLSSYVSGENLVFSGSTYPGTTLDTATGVITGAPTLEGSVSRIFTARNEGGSVNIPLGGTVTAVAPALGDPVPAQTLTQGIAMTPLDLRDYVTGSNLTFAITSGSLPDGLSFTGGVVSGTSNLLRTAANVTFGVSNGGGSVSLVASFAVVAASVAPVITQNVAMDDTTDTWGIASDQTGGVLHFARYTGTAPTANGSGGWTGTTLQEGTVPYTGGPVNLPTNGTTGEVYSIAVYHRNNSLDSNVLAATYTEDNTPPTVTIPTLTAGNGTANLTPSTTKTGGTMFRLLTLASETAPDADAVKGGTGVAVTVTGAQTLITLSGLTNDTQYRISFLHRDSHRNDSDVEHALFTPTTGASNIVTPIVDGFIIEDVAFVPDVTATAIADGFLIEDI